MSSISLNFESNNIDEFKEELSQVKAKALEEIGLIAEGYAKHLCPVDTGRLRNSISHAVDGDNAYIGTNVEYAPYVELGTGKYTEGGRTTPWKYQDENGKWHVTSGMKPRPFLRPAAEEHGQEYSQILKDALLGE